VVLQPDFRTCGEIPDKGNLFREYARDYTSTCCLCMPKSYPGKVFWLFTFGKHHFRHAAAHGSPEVHTGKITNVFKPQTLNFFCCALESDLTILVARQ
jgi:hypothetical protein